MHRLLKLEGGCQTRSVAVSIPPRKPTDQIMLFRKPESLHPPCRLIGRPFNLKMPQNLGNELTHLHDRYVFPNTRAGIVTELVVRSGNISG